MDAGSVFTTLEQNLENVRSFLYIQKIRFEKKLEYHFSVEDEVLACKTLRFLMQPLVENTIKHGVQPCKHPCMIEIVAQRKGERLIIRVEDNGVGIDEATLEELRNQWENIENIQVEDRHVGLINLMKRLWLCYQREASFIIAGKEGQGAKIEVGIPVDFHSESLKKSEQIPPLTTPLIQKIF
jgi:two-component system sensor histidine kinase YesM